MNSHSYRRDLQQPLVAFAERIVADRSRRKQVLPTEMFGEPAWDMLLALYVAAASGGSLASLADAAGVPESTAVRWLRYLGARDLITAGSAGSGDVVSNWRLTDKAVEAIEAYLKSSDLRAGAI